MQAERNRSILNLIAQSSDAMDMVEPLILKIKNKGGSSITDFEDVWKRPEFYSGIDSKPLTIKRVRGCVSELQAYADATHESKPLKERQIHSRITNVKGFIRAANAYLNNSGSSTLADHIKQWNVYFHSKSPHKSPAIGHAILEVNENSQNATIYNTNSDGRENFSGRVEVSDNNIKNFILKSDADGEYLFIKKYRAKHTLSDKVALGCYTTYENNNLVVGVLVFSTIDPDDSPDDQVKLGRVLVNNCACVDKQNCTCPWYSLDQNIRRYLSVRSRNFLPIPSSLHTIKSLSDHLDIVSSPGRYSRFFQVGRKPRVFVSSNTAFRNGNAAFLEEALRFMKVNIGDDYVFEIREEGKREGFNSSRALKQIAESDLFVLFYSKVDRASFSLIELGWALAHTKKCLVVCERNAMDFRVLNNGKIEVVIIGETGSDAEDLNRVEELTLDLVSKMESDHSHN